MCGILAMLGLREGAPKFRNTALELSKLLRHRGPDWNGVYAKGSNIICHERLSIVDLRSGAQPLWNENKDTVLSVNGEIYNHLDLRKELLETGRHSFASHSDCEPILHLYEEQGGDFLNKLTGMFAFVLYDEKNDRYLAARDPMGIIPLYYGFGKDGSMWFSSEMKALVNHCSKSLHAFPPGHYFDSKTGQFVKYYQPQWADSQNFYPSDPLDLKKLRNALERSVESHLMSDVPFGVLLSGGLDSSLISAIAKKQMDRLHVETGAVFPKLQSFSIGLENSPDLKAAQEVADYLGTNHYNFNFTIQQGLDALSDVIYHIETYDVTTIRASTPMYLMARMIKATGVKMVLSGEGADEIFGGYLYFHKAPNPVEFYKETVRKLESLHLYDCLRANKAMSAWGVETRVPFLDREFLDVAMNIDPKYKMARDDSGKKRMEKYIVRAAFDEPSASHQRPLLPASVLWRQKEQFSDGVGYGWIDGLKDYAEKAISDSMFASAQYRFPHNTPQTKEAYLYRSIFESHFPSDAAEKTVPGGPSIACSTPAAIEWDEAFKKSLDPSGRAVAGVHNDSYKGKE
jgi:asparagine synthase (glutamine-hydrolysing)